ncbi:MAG: hypothetical protein IT337_16455 [Thermomicrobiales bacterium]|nr:hypothetical protein [Thermomicrobiales bacterium]
MPEAPPVSPQLLLTKLRPPRLGRDIVPRPRLLTRLRDGFDGPLALVTAPAGFGKTTLVVAALADYDGPWGWLTLDDNDNDLPTFLEHLIAAVQAAFPDAGRTTLALLRQPRTPSVDLLARTLANELAALPQGFLLVLDEYNAIRQPLVPTLLDRLLQHPTSGMHLVVMSRVRPGLSLARLRARGQVLEIDAADLCFTRAETEAFLGRSFGLPIPEAMLTELEQRTEGWGAGLRMIALAAKGRAPMSALVQALAGGEAAAVREFLLDEVFAAQPPETQDFLLQTSPFDRICAPLADAVLARSGGESDSPLILDQLVRDNVFITVLDDRGVWHRYHSLFRDALRERLAERTTSGERAALHRRGSDWFARKGLIEEAVRHALLAEDRALAGRIVEDHVSIALAHEAWPSVERWLHQLPADCVASEPGLLLARAWILQLRWRLGEIPALLDAVDDRLHQLDYEIGDAKRQAILAHVETLRGLVLVVSGEMERGFKRALVGWRGTPVVDQYQRGVAAFVLAMAAHGLGRGEWRGDLLRDEGTSSPSRGGVVATRVQFGYAYQRLADGDLPGCKAVLLPILQPAEEHNRRLSDSWVHYTLGLVCYEWNDLAGAAEQFRMVIDRRHQAHVLPLQGSLFGLALTLTAQGRAESARVLMEALVESAYGAWSPPLLALVRSFQARLALRAGDVETAAHWLPDIDAQSSFVPVFAIEAPELTQAWLGIVRGTAQSIAEATDRLVVLARDYAAWRDTRRLIHVLALQALAAQARGAPDQALTLLERALALAEPGLHVRTFVDLGFPMKRLLEDVAARGVADAYAGRLLLAFGDAPDPHQPRRTDQSGSPIESLTRREQQILRLLERRLTDREIADDLHISWQTVATHTRHIYQKLQVSGRREAVARARELNLLPAG